MKTRLRILSFLLFAIAWCQLRAQSGNEIRINDLLISRDGRAVLSVMMNNTADITAIEFNLTLPEGFSINPLSAVLSERAEDHQVSVRKLRNGQYKFVVFSSTNANLRGIAGRLLTVQVSSTLQVTDEEVYPIEISQAVMSIQSGENVIDASFAGQIKVKSMPNLHVSSLDCSEAIAGKPMTVKWKVRNDGRGNTGNTQWKDYVWLVPNIAGGTSMTGSKLLATVDNLAALQPGESYENTVNVTLEERIYGNYDLLVTTNMYGVNHIDFSATGNEPPIPYLPGSSSYGYLTGQASASYVTVEEENEFEGLSDNFFYKRLNIEVPPLPDLQVLRVAAVVDNINFTEKEYFLPSPLNSAGLGSSTAFYSGKRVKVTATLANKGQESIANKTIHNELYISSTPELGEGKAYRLATNDLTINLLEDQTTELSFRTNIPYEWNGDTYFCVVADVNDAVYELANTANNRGVTDRINVLLAPGADFEPYQIAAPKEIAPGQEFEVKYAVRNMGAGVPYVNRWTDQIFLSSNGEGFDEEAKLLSSISRTGTYRMYSERYQYFGDSYEETAKVHVNGLPEGIYYIYVVVDKDNLVFEYDGEANNVIRSDAITLAKPDLTTEWNSISEETLIAGNTVSFSWKLKNSGTMDLSNVSLEDAFYACSDANGSHPILLGKATNVVSLPAGGEKVLRANLVIPNDPQLNGLKQLVVTTNVNHVVDETSTENNTSAAWAKQCVYVENPQDIVVQGTNLTVYGLTCPSQITPGEEIELTYKIKNTGSLAIGTEVTQELFLSNERNAVGSTPLTALNELPTVVNLAAGEEVIANVRVQIPSDLMGGNKYVHLWVDKNAILLEKSKDDNHQVVPTYMEGNLPELSLAELTIPEAIWTAAPTTIHWKISNNGDWDAKSVICNVYRESLSASTQRKLIGQVRLQSLSKGETATMSEQVEIPDGWTGRGKLIVCIDPSSENWDKELADNELSSTFEVRQSPLPDLKIADLSYEGEWRGGQTVTLKAKVHNVGDSITRKDKWADAFYLSDDYNLDVQKAIRLGEKMHVGKLDKEGSYELITTCNLPMDLKGYYVLFAVSDVTESMVEKQKANNQVKTTIYIEDLNSTPSDLIVKTVSAPAVIQAGESVTFSYTIANEGQFAAKGKLRDVFYLSEDALWDEQDAMIGVVTGDIDLEPGNSCVRNATGRITNIPEGTYYLVVRTNSTHAIAETDYDNNFKTQQAGMKVEFAQLAIGESATMHTSGLFKLSVHAGLSGKTMGCYLSATEKQSVGMYASFQQVPSSATYHWISSLANGEGQELLIPNVQEGTYYLLVQDQEAIKRSLNEFVLEGAEEQETESGMSVSVREVEFGATTLSMREGGTNGWISTEIRGALLDSIMDFRLMQGEEMIPAESITFHSSTSSKATFNLNKAKVGVYDVVSELPNGTRSALSQSFKVVAGINTNLGVKLDAPHQTRVSGYAPVSITYVNSGNTDIVIRELLLKIEGGLVATTIEEFKEKKTALHIRPDVQQDNRGFVVIPPGKQETINCYFMQTSGWTYLNLYIVK